MNGEVKFVQGYQSRKFKGICILVSNLSPSLTYGVSAALNDRLIPIEFSPRLGIADPTLLKKLLSNVSGIINHLMNLDQSIFPHLTRAGLINKEAQVDSNSLVEFISKELYFETEAQLSVLALIEGHKRWLVTKGHEKPKYLYDLPIDLAAMALAIFNKRIIKDRKPHFGRKTTVLVGVRWREPTDPKQNENSVITCNNKRYLGRYKGYYGRAFLRGY